MIGSMSILVDTTPESCKTQHVCIRYSKEQVNMASLRDQFLLNPDVVFLNHGSFGACPKPVFEKYQAWQLELERQPVEFLGRRFEALMADARQHLGAFLNAAPDDLIFVPNATTGLNTVARSLQLTLQPGDEILTTNHEYGALNRTWEFISKYTGAKYINYPIPMPVTTAEAFIDSFWQGVTPRTKIIFLSHITSPTALTFPVKEICRRARQQGIMTIIDGAHVPGQLPLDLTDLDADIYSGNLHKWLCAPKGSAFLHVRPEHHHWIEPLVISHGWLADGTFISQNEWQGTRDIAAFLAVPDAIAFQQAHDWATVRKACHQLASDTYQRMLAFTEQEPLSPDSPEWFMQMVALPLPPCDVAQVKTRLYDEFRVEAPVFEHNGRPIVRASFQGYNTAQDADALVNAIRTIFS